MKFESRKVEVAANDVDKQVDQLVLNKGKSERQSGFRKGKVPLSILKSKYYFPMLNSALEEKGRELIFKDYPDLQYASSPYLASQEKKGSTYVLQMEFEVWPEVKLNKLKKTALEIPRVAINEEDISAERKMIIQRFKEWKDLDEHSTPPTAVEGDKCVIDYDASYKGKAFQGSHGEDQSYTLEMGEYLGDLTKSLEGCSQGDVIKAKVAMPKQYRDRTVAGKKVDFEIVVKKVLRGHEPELTKEYFKSLGFDCNTVEEFDSELEKNMEKQLQLKLESLKFGIAMKTLSEDNKVVVPQTPVNEHMAKYLSENGVKNLAEIPKEEIESVRMYSENVVRSSLLMRTLLTEHELLEVTEEQITTYVSSRLEAHSQVEDVEKEMQKIMANKSTKSQYTNQLLQNRVLDILLQECNVTEKEYSYKEVMSMN